MAGFNKKQFKQYAFHELCQQAPNIERAKLLEMAEDIKVNGQQIPIVLYEGKILDGRLRYEACKHIGVMPRYTTYKGNNPLAFVVSANLLRRHLHTAQRAMYAARLYEAVLAIDGKAKNNGYSLQYVARLAKVSATTVQKAIKINKDEQLRQAVTDGQLSVHRATQLLRMQSCDAVRAYSRKDKDVSQRTLNKQVADLMRSLRSSGTAAVNVERVLSALLDSYSDLGQNQRADVKKYAQMIYPTFVRIKEMCEDLRRKR